MTDRPIPPLDHSPEAMQAAYAALDQISTTTSLATAQAVARLTMMALRRPDANKEADT
jgi:hypothetical protein